jgi:hypothetical protein
LQEDKGLYPTLQHRAAAEALQDYFQFDPAVEAVLLTNSTARGKATPDSCLDIAVFLHPEKFEGCHQAVEAGWQKYYASAPVFRALESAGHFAEVHLDVIGYPFRPGKRDWMSEPDSFELEIGNFLVYAKPLWQRRQVFQDFRARWLPYYDEPLRRQRLEETRNYCRNNLAHIYLYAPRGLLFACLHRLFLAQREFLQALFIARRTYPIAYDKWIHEQLVDILGEPELYAQLTGILSVSPFTDKNFDTAAHRLESLLEKYT